VSVCLANVESGLCVHGKCIPLAAALINNVPYATVYAPIACLQLHCDPSSGRHTVPAAALVPLNLGAVLDAITCKYMHVFCLDSCNMPKGLMLTLCAGWCFVVVAVVW